MRTFILLLMFTSFLSAQPQRLRDHGITIGVLPIGKHNAITDVSGVKVGHVTKIEGEGVRTGVTAVVPHDQNIFQHKIPAAIFIGNGFGKLVGYSQVEELGNLETPIVLTNTLSVAQCIEGIIDYTFSFAENKDVRSVNAVVGETNDGFLNDIQGRHLSKQDVLNAIQRAESGNVAEGSVGAGTGTMAFGFKGGIGTSSRKLPKSLGGYTVGVLVQSNFGGVLEIAGVPIDVALGRNLYKREIEEAKADGSCMIVVATDAPITSRNLKRLAQRAMLGLAKTGGIASNGSGDYVIAFSTAESLRIPHQSTSRTLDVIELRNEAMTPLFLATIEATEEAILNALFMATKITGRNENTANPLPIEQVLEIMRKYGRVR